MSIYFKSRNKPVNKYVIRPNKLLIYWPFIILPFCSIFSIYQILVYFYWWIVLIYLFFIFIPINIFLVNRLQNIYFWNLNRYVLKSCISSNLSVPFGLFWCLMCFLLLKFWVYYLPSLTNTSPSIIFFITPQRTNFNIFCFPVYLS